MSDNKDLIFMYIFIFFFVALAVILIAYSSDEIEPVCDNQYRIGYWQGDDFSFRMTENEAFEYCRFEDVTE